MSLLIKSYHIYRVTFRVSSRLNDIEKKKSINICKVYLSKKDKAKNCMQLLKYIHNPHISGIYYYAILLYYFAIFSLFTRFVYPGILD